MPIKIPNSLPAAQVLESENIFFMDAERAYSQDIRPLRLLILNLMPNKSVTETQLLRLLGNTPLQVEVDFIYTESYVPQHTSQDYLAEFYGTFAEVRHKKYDGFLITGAPVEQMPFREVAYWDEVALLFVLPHLLGRTGGALLPLRHRQAGDGTEGLRRLQASSVRRA